MTDTLQKMIVNPHKGMAEISLGDELMLVVLTLNAGVNYCPVGEDTAGFWARLEADLDLWGVAVEDYLDALPTLSAKTSGYAALLRLTALDGGGAASLPVRPRLRVA